MCTNTYITPRPRGSTLQASVKLDTLEIPKPKELPPKMNSKNQRALTPYLKHRK